MNKSDLKIVVGAVLDDMDESSLRILLKHKTGTIYRLATLKNMVRKDPPKYGICSVIGNIELVSALSPTWKHFSGNVVFPVPGNDKNKGPEDSYFYGHPNKDKWIGQQKRYRFSLIDHLLENAAYFYKEVEKRLSN